MKAEQLADEAWREISHEYAKYTKEDYLALYKLFLSAFVKGFKAHRALLQSARGSKS